MAFGELLGMKVKKFKLVVDQDGMVVLSSLNDGDHYFDNVCFCTPGGVATEFAEFMKSLKNGDTIILSRGSDNATV